MATKTHHPIEAQLLQLQEVAALQQKRIEELTAQIRARGTGNLTAKAAIAAGKRDHAVEDLTTGEKIELALRAKPRSLVELAGILTLTPGATIVAVRRMHDHVYNLGTESSPRWFWRVGDEGPTAELSAAVEQLIRERPLTHQDLIDATGARGNRISGVLVKLQQHGHKVQNLGSAAVARWFLAPAVRKR